MRSLLQRLGWEREREREQNPIYSTSRYDSVRAIINHGAKTDGGSTISRLCAHRHALTIPPLAVDFAGASWSRPTYSHLLLPPVYSQMRETTTDSSLARSFLLRRLIREHYQSYDLNVLCLWSDYSLWLFFYSNLVNGLKFRVYHLLPFSRCAIPFFFQYSI